MDDVVLFNELYDLYGGLLTQKQREYFEDYYFNNMSFSEMADDYDVSRNAVFKQVHIVTDKLEEYESILHLREKNVKIKDKIKNISSDLRNEIEDILDN